MITVRAGSAAIGLCLVLLTSGCSREQQDWRSAEAADTIDSYGQFIQRHPESELVTQARTRVAQLGEDRDWQRAGSADTVDAYREFISQHPSGKWAQEANIRIQNFSLGEEAGTDAATQATGAAGGASAGAGLAVGGARAVPALPVASRASASGVSTAGAAAASAAKPSPSVTSTVSAGAAAAHAPAPPQATAAKGGFGIQLGAFSSEASASAQWGTLSAKYASQLQGLTQHVVPAGTASGRVYRLQATVGDEGRARAICDQLRQHGQACVAVLPH